MDISIGFSDNIFFVLKDQDYARKEIEKTLSETRDRLNNQLNSALVIVKGIIGYRINTSSVINRKIKEESKAREKAQQARHRSNQVSESIKREEESKSSIGDFAEFLNEVLRDLEMNFHLECVDGLSYVLKLNDSGGVMKIEDLSEGERNLLAFLFFYFKLFKDREQRDVIDNLAAVIIDDPTSSMDTQNKFYVINLLRHLLNQNVQVFLFTHVWDDFCSLVYGKKKRAESKCALYGIIKIESESKLVVCRSCISPYKRLFEDVCNFVDMRQDDPMFEALAPHISNSIRRILEEYLAFQGNIRVISTGKEAAIAEVLYQSEGGWNKLSQTKKNKLMLLINVSNVFSHRPPSNEDYKEVKQAAKILMDAIKKQTPAHYHAMKKK